MAQVFVSFLHQSPCDGNSGCPLPPAHERTSGYIPAMHHTCWHILYCPRRPRCLSLDLPHSQFSPPVDNLEMKISMSFEHMNVKKSSLTCPTVQLIVSFPTVSYRIVYGQVGHIIYVFASIYGTVMVTAVTLGRLQYGRNLRMKLRSGPS